MSSTAVRSTCNDLRPQNHSKTRRNACTRHSQWCTRQSHRVVRRRVALYGVLIPATAATAVRQRRPRRSSCDRPQLRRSRSHGLDTLAAAPDARARVPGSDAYEVAVAPADASADRRGRDLWHESKPATHRLRQVGPRVLWERVLRLGRPRRRIRRRRLRRPGRVPRERRRRRPLRQGADERHRRTRVRGRPGRLPVPVLSRVAVALHDEWVSRHDRRVC